MQQQLKNYHLDYYHITELKATELLRREQKMASEAYISLFACSLLRAVHIELLTDETTKGFINI